MHPFPTLLKYQNTFFISQNSLFYMHKHNISFPYIRSNKYLKNSCDSSDKNLNVKSVYLFLSVLFLKNLFSLFLSTFSILRNVQTILDTRGRSH